MVTSLKVLLPLVLVVALLVLAVFQLVGQSTVECKVCVRFNQLRECATAAAPAEAEAREAAQRSACSRLTSGVSDAFNCPRVIPEEVSCKPH